MVRKLTAASPRLKRGSKSNEEEALERAQRDAAGNFWSPQAAGEFLQGVIVKREHRPARKGWQAQDVLTVRQKDGAEKMVGCSTVIASRIEAIDNAAKVKGALYPAAVAGSGICIVYRGLQGNAKPGSKIKGRSPAKLYGVSTYAV